MIVTKAIRGYIISIVVTVAVCYLLFGVIGGIAVVHGSSMNPTYTDGQLLPLFRLGNIDYGDVVVCKCDALNENIIKRVIGLPGDTIEIKHGTTYRNGEAIKEEYININYNDNMDVFTVSDDMVFLMGDNRGNSTDSRNPAVGEQCQEDIIGKVLGGRISAG